MAHADEVGTVRVSVAYSPAPRVVDETALTLAGGATVADALRASALQARHPSLDLAAAKLGVWGVACLPDQRLRDRDRVEVYRALQVDPKAARRLRDQAQRAGAGRIKR